MLEGIRLAVVIGGRKRRHTGETLERITSFKSKKLFLLTFMKFYEK
jgi:hypothetical protein